MGSHRGTHTAEQKYYSVLVTYNKDYTSDIGYTSKCSPGLATASHMNNLSLLTCVFIWALNQTVVHLSRNPPQPHTDSWHVYLDHLGFNQNSGSSVQEVPTTPHRLLLQLIYYSFQTRDLNPLIAFSTMAFSSAFSNTYDRAATLWLQHNR